MKIKVAVLCALVVACAVSAFATLQAEPTVIVHEHHPKIHHAIKALEEARHELKEAPHDFGGHREAAVKECDAAIEQLKLALEHDKK